MGEMRLGAFVGGGLICGMIDGCFGRMNGMSVFVYRYMGICVNLFYFASYYKVSSELMVPSSG